MKATVARRQVLGIGIAAAAGLVGLTPPARAGPCGPRDQLIKELANVFKERRVAAGRIPSGEMFEIFVSPGATWTAVVSMPGGTACMVAAGDTWTWTQPQKGIEA